MKIAHYAPFAPNACGLYEAAKDMYTADKIAGLEVCFVDTGITINGERKNNPGEAGKVDRRGQVELTSITPEQALSADVIIAHTGIPDNWIVGSQSPIIWILHGRPAACFKPEVMGNGSSYTLLSKLASWSRVKTMLTFWPYHTQYWEETIPKEKLMCFPAPPIDSSRFSPNGKKHEFKLKGKHNVVFADTQREDVDIFEYLHGAIKFAKHNKDVVFHFYGMPNPLGPWELLLLQLKKLNALGDVWARKTEMEEVLRAADLLISPHRITTRIIAEALCCGTPVIANGCEFATWNCDEVESLPDVIEGALYGISNNLENIQSDCISTATNFSLTKYNNQMEKVYANL